MIDEDAGDDALQQLADIRRSRHRLDEQELAAVRAARRAGRSWAEIATMLGITRQSAWERWNDLDLPADAPTDAPTDSPTDSPTDQASVALVAAAKSSRRSATIKVPELTGMSFALASQRLQRIGLHGVPMEVDPLLRDDLPSLLVRAQAPEAGARLGAGSPVRLWLRGTGEGGAGVREPRRPTPRTGQGQAMRRIS